MGAAFGMMRLTILLAILVCAASGCMSMPAAGAGAAAAPPTSATAGATTIVAVAPPASPPCTIWQFLGADQFHADMAAKCACMLYILRPYLPVLDSPPPPPPIDDPANLESPNPAVKAAAEVKGEEDAAPAKAQALEYLASVGCGCYPDVQEALVSGLDDCTEMVRFAAASALYKAAGHPCQTCKSSSCCGPLVREKLMQIAYETKDNACYFEPSARVRRMARLALEACGGACPVPIPELPEEAPVPRRAPPPAPGAEASAASGNRPLPTAVIAELQGAGPASAGVTRKSIMAATQLRGEPATDVKLTSDSQSTADEEAGRVIATVNGQKIYESELDVAFQTRLADLNGEPTEDEQRRMYRDALLWAIDIRLLLDGGDERREKSVLAKAGHTKRASTGITPENEARARARLDEAARSNVRISQDAILDRYRRNISQYRTPPSVRWEQVVVPFDQHHGREEAKAVVRRLRQRWLGGQLPPVDEGKLDKVRVELVGWTAVSEVQPTQMRQMLTQLAIGQLSPIFEDGTGYRMIRVLERRDEQTKPLSELTAQIEAELRRERQHNAEQEYLTGLRQQAEIWTLIPLGEITTP